MMQDNVVVHNQLSVCLAVYRLFISTQLAFFAILLIKFNFSSVDTNNFIQTDV